MIVDFHYNNRNYLTLMELLLWSYIYDNGINVNNEIMYVITIELCYNMELCFNQIALLMVLCYDNGIMLQYWNSIAISFNLKFNYNYNSAANYNDKLSA